VTFEQRISCRWILRCIQGREATLQKDRETVRLAPTDTSVSDDSTTPTCTSQSRSQLVRPLSFILTRIDRFDGHHQRRDAHEMLNEESFREGGFLADIAASSGTLGGLPRRAKYRNFDTVSR
jgi:hypothetical protein